MSLAMSETEDNNTSSKADELSSGSKIDGQLSSSSDVDWFKYTATGAASLNLAFDLPTSSNSDYFPSRCNSLMAPL